MLQHCGRAGATQSVVIHVQRGSVKVHPHSEQVVGLRQLRVQSTEVGSELCRVQ